MPNNVQLAFDLIAKVDNAETNINKVVTLLSSLPKQLIIDMLISDSKQGVSAAIGQLTKGLGLTSKEAEAFRDKFTEMIEALQNGMSDFSNKQISRVLKDIEKTENLSVSASKKLNQLSSSFGIEKQDFQLVNNLRESYARLAEAFFAMKQASQGEGPFDITTAQSNFAKLSDIIGRTSAQIDKAANSSLNLGVAFKQLDVLPSIRQLNNLGAIVGSGQVFQSPEQMRTLFSTLKTSLSEIEAEMLKIKLKGFANVEDLAKYQQLLNDFQRIDEILSILSNKESVLGNLLIANEFNPSGANDVLNLLEQSDDVIKDLKNSSQDLGKGFETVKTKADEFLRILKSGGPNQFNFGDTVLDKLFNGYLKAQNDVINKQREINVLVKQQNQAVAELDKIDTSTRSGEQDASTKRREIQNLNEQIERERKSLSDLTQETERASIPVKEYRDTLAQLQEALKFNTFSLKRLQELYKEVTGSTIASNDADVVKAKLIEQIGVKYGVLAKKVGQANKETKDIGTLNLNATNTFDQLNGKVKDFNFFMTIAIEKIIRYRVAFFAMAKAVELLKQVFTLPKEAETSFVRLSKVINENTTSLKTLRQSSIDLGTNFGVSIKEVTDIMFIWAQQGKSQNEILQLTKATLLGVVGAQLTATQAAEVLTSATRVYNISAEDSVIIFDKLIKVQKDFAVETTDLADAIKLIGESAEGFGISIDSLFGSLTAIIQVTRRSGNQVATSLKTIFARFLQDDVIQSLRNLGIAVFDTEGGIRKLDDILDDLSGKWDSLTDAQKLNLATLVGGIRQYPQFLTLMDQYGVKLDATLKSQLAFGEAASATQKDLSTLQNKLNSLNTIFSAFGIAVGESELGFFTTAKGLANIALALNDFVKKIPNFTTAMAQITGAITGLGSAYFVFKGISIGASIATDKLASSFAGKNLNSVVEFEKATDRVSKGVRKFLSIGANEQFRLKNLTEFTKSADQVIRITKELEIYKQSIISADGKIVHLTKSGKDLKAVTLTQNEAIKKGIIVLDAAGNANLALATSTTIAGRAALGASAFFKTLWASIVSVISVESILTLGLSLLAGVVFNELIKKLFKGKEHVDNLSDSLNNIADRFKGASETSKSLTVLTANLGTKFAILNDKINNGIPGSKEQIESFGQMFALMHRIRGLGGNLALVDPTEILDAKRRNDILEELQNVLEQNTKEMILYKEAANQASQAQIRNFNNIRKAITEALQVAQIFTDVQKQLNIKQLKNNTTFSDLFPPDTFIKFGKASKSTEEQIVLNKLLTTSLQNVAKESQKLARDPSTKDKFKDVAFSTKDASDAVNNLNTAMRKLQEQGKQPQSFDELLKLGGDSGNKVIKFFEILNNEASDVTSQMDKLREASAEAFQGIILNNGLTIKETEQLNSEISKLAGTALTAFNNVGKAIDKDLTKSLAEGGSSKYWDIVFSKLQEVKDKFDEPLIKAEDDLNIAKRAKTINEALSSMTREGKSTEIASAFANIANIQDEIAQKTIELKGKSKEQTLTIQDQLNELSTQLLGQKQAVLETLSKNTPEFQVPLDQFDEVFSRISVRLKDFSSDGKSAFQILTDAIDGSRKSLDTEIAQLELKRNRLALINTTSAEYLKTVKDLNTAAENKAAVESLERQTVLIREQAKLTSEIAQDFLRKNELGRRAIADEIQKENAKLESQANISQAIQKEMLSVNVPLNQAFKIINGITNGSLTWQDAIEAIKQGYLASVPGLKELDKRGQTMLANIIAQKEQEDKLLESRLRSLDIQARVGDIVSVTGDKIGQTEDVIKKMRDAYKEIAKLSGKNEEDYIGVQTASKAILDLEKLKIGIQLKSVDILERAGILTQLQAKAARLAFNTQSDVGKSAIQVEIDLLLGKLEKLKDTFKAIDDKRKLFAKGITDAFASIPTSVLERYKSIADESFSIKQKQADINVLQSELSKITDVNSDKYKELTQQIAEGNFELNKMKQTLNELSTSSALKSVLGEFAKQLGDLALKIQTDELKSNLEEFFTKNTFGQKMADVLLSASERGADAYAARLKEQLNNLLPQFLTDVQNAANQSLFALQKSVNPAEQSFIDLLKNSRFGGGSINTSLSGTTPEEAARKAFREANGIGTQSFGTSNFDKNGNLTFNSNVETSLGQLVAQGEFLNSVSAKTGKTSQDLGNKQVAETKELGAGQKALASSVNMLALGLGTAFGANTFGAENAGAASTGSQLGGLLGTGISGSVSALSGTFLGAILPGVGSIFGGLVGGLIGKLSGSNERKIQTQFRAIEKNTQELAKNTDAVRSLNTDFVDLRDQLINAPGRFNLPSGPGLRFIGNNASSNSTGIPTSIGGAITLNFNVNGNLDQNAANSLGSQISEIFSNQGRVNSSNARLFR